VVADPEALEVVVLVASEAASEAALVAALAVPNK
jgi:hypothetical protein